VLDKDLMMLPTDMVSSPPRAVSASSRREMVLQVHFRTAAHSFFPLPFSLQALMSDPEFKKWVDIYAEDKDR
jgi:hypothetical protein